MTIKSKLERELKSIVGPEFVLTSDIDRETYAYDSSTFHHLPEFVVLPQNALEISQIMQLANETGVPVVPRGAGTCLCGGAVPIRGGIVLTTSRMTRIIDVDIPNERVLVEAGVTSLEVQQAVQEYGYMYAPDPASNRVSTIGGNIAENAGGMRCVKYGVTKDHVLGLEVVLPGGNIILTGCLAEDSGTPDLTQLFIASEGMLGVVTKAMLKLIRVPLSITTLLVSFSTIEDAGAAVADIVSCGIVPLAMEIMDDITVQAVDDYIHYGFPKGCTVMLIDLEGYKEELADQQKALRNILNKNFAVDIKAAKDDNERSMLWNARQSMNGALGRIRPGQLILDPTIPTNKLAPVFKQIKQIAGDLGLIIPQQAHAGDGNLHPSLMFDPSDKEESAKIEKAAEEIFKVVLSAGGTLSGEHGIGLEKRDFMSWQFSNDELSFMKTIKQTFDPNLILNPNKKINI